MTVKECAEDAGRHGESIRRWIRSGRLAAKKVGFGEYMIPPDVWEKFCEENNIARGVISK